MDPNSVVVFDLETTGRNPLTAEILQISMVNGNGGNLFTSYIKPKHKKTWKDAEKINHISQV